VFNFGHSHEQTETPAMKVQNIYQLLHIDDFSATPKYLQLANSIIEGIRQGKLELNDSLPSINELSFEFEISRDTAEKGYKYLKKRGVLGSIPGKGYFIKSTETSLKLKIFLLFNKLSPHKKIIYDSFVSVLGDTAAIDFYIYNNDFHLFKQLLTQKKNEEYTHYVIIPHFLEGGEKAHEIINTIPKDKLLLLDKELPGVAGNYASVYENFEQDIYSALEQAKPQLSKYQKLKIIFPEDSYFPVEILTGFKHFCQEYAFVCSVVHSIEKEPITPGEVYITLMDQDLVTLIERIISMNLKVGEDIGVISYNESPMKRIILNGITTISTDFDMMGQKAAQLVLENAKEHIEIPFKLMLRPSL
jgi:DNA-binding transcriptional regulator YhcF (GntR family)